MTNQQYLEILNNIRKQAPVPYEAHAQADAAYEALKKALDSVAKKDK